MARSPRIFARQTWALTKKTLLIAVVRHWFSTFLRTWCRQPCASPKSRRQPPNRAEAGVCPTFGTWARCCDCGKQIGGPSTCGQEACLPYQTRRPPHYMQGELARRLRLFCCSRLQRLSSDNEEEWHMELHRPYGFGLEWGSFQVMRHNNDQQRVYLPLQVALDNAIANATIIPNEYMFTTISQATQDDNVRKAYQGLIISTYAIVFFISMVSSVYHLVGMVTTERESGMTQLIDAMGGSATARIWSYVLAFDMTYLPAWIVMGAGMHQPSAQTSLTVAVFWVDVFHTSNFAILLFWQIFTRMAVTSASVFAAIFFSRAQLSGI